MWLDMKSRNTEKLQFKFGCKNTKKKERRNARKRLHRQREKRRVGGGKRLRARRINDKKNITIPDED